jgi:hypothetical protein
MPSKLSTIRAKPHPENHREEADLIRLSTREFRLSRDHWEELSLPTNLTWQTAKFEQASRTAIPSNQKGVYTFVISPGIANHPNCSYLIYVGMVKSKGRSFRQRFNEYLKDQIGLKTKRLKIHEVLDRWDGYLWFCYAAISNESLIDKVEEELIDAFIPPYNKQFRGSVAGAIKVLA